MRAIYCGSHHYQDNMLKAYWRILKIYCLCVPYRKCDKSLFLFAVVSSSEISIDLTGGLLHWRVVLSCNIELWIDTVYMSKCQVICAFLPSHYRYLPFCISQNASRNAYRSETIFQSFLAAFGIALNHERSWILIQNFP